MAESSEKPKCPKCGRPLDPWPLVRKGCSPPDWVMCIRSTHEKET